MDSRALEKYILSLGASRVGFARLEGRDLPGAMGFPCAISFACEVSRGIIDTLLTGPTLPYYEEYIKKNLLLNRIAKEVVFLLQKEGYRAEAIQCTVTDDGRESGYIEAFNNTLSHKTVATLSGLGWIGKNVLLITPEFGPRVRLGSVLTNMPLEVGTPEYVGRCGNCTACVDVCPAKALKGKEWYTGLEREALFDAYACRKKALELSSKIGIRDSICGVCIRACPLGVTPFPREKRMAFGWRTFP
ncbi:MAG TPA: 4Fe-4S double cluster binding domain-containing protein [Candidatus Hypogeohydataceae bacterium YC41]